MSIYHEQAKEWLLTHGYKQWADGTWSAGGYEVDTQEALAEYIAERIEEQHATGGMPTKPVV